MTSISIMSSPSQDIQKLSKVLNSWFQQELLLVAIHKSWCLHSFFKESKIQIKTNITQSHHNTCWHSHNNVSHVPLFLEFVFSLATVDMHLGA